MENYPSIGSLWKHNVYDDKVITIVDPSRGMNSTRKIVWKYNKTGVIGGCESCEWFYDDWVPFLEPNIKKNPFEPGSLWLEKEGEGGGDIVELTNTIADEVIYEYKTGGVENKYFRITKKEFINKFTKINN